METAIINGVRIGYIDRGNKDGLPIVFMHGMAFDHQMWTPQIKLFENGFRVVAFDMRGHGRSEAGDGQFTFRHLAEDCVGLLDHLGIEQAVLCGLSMGGAVAQRVFELHPEPVRALVLCDTTCQADTDDSKKRRELAIQSIKKEGMGPFTEGFLKTVFAPANFSKHGEAIEKIRGIILSSPPIGICGALLAQAARTDLCRMLFQIDVPTLVMVGAEDSLSTPDMMETMAESIPNAHFRVIPEAAHVSNLENTEEFNRELQAFLRSL